MKVLIVDDSAHTLEYMADAVTNFGHSVRTAKNGVIGLKIFKEFRPRLVISDIRMPQMDGLELLRNIRAKDPDASVIMATAFGCEDYAAEALELGAKGYLTKPVRQADLLPLLDKYDEIEKEGVRKSTIRGMVSTRRFRMEVPSRVDHLSDIAEQLVVETRGMIGRPQEASLYLGLYELLANAVVHGNLEITHIERKCALQSSPNGLRDLYASREADPVLSKRLVTVECVIDEDGCEWTIADEGKGFDWQSYLKSVEGVYPTHSEQRGILLNQLRFDELEYTGRGNVVRAKKFSKR